VIGRPLAQARGGHVEPAVAVGVEGDAAAVHRLISSWEPLKSVA
jgi:hypothetical protein